MSESRLDLRIAKNKDYDAYLSLRSEKPNLFWTGHNSPPDYTKFKDWYRKRLNEPNRSLYLLFKEDICIGSLNLDFYNNHALIGYSINENNEGQGFATYIVQNAIRFAAERKMILSIKAWINLKNFASIKVVEKNGFYKSDQFEKRLRFGKQELYYQYILDL